MQKHFLPILTNHAYSSSVILPTCLIVYSPTLICVTHFTHTIYMYFYVDENDIGGDIEEVMFR